MDDVARLARVYAWSRIAIGVAITAAPRLVTPWLAEPAATGAIRMVGVRDLGLGMLALVDPGATTWRRTMALCAATDAADALVAVRRAQLGHRRARLAAVAGAVGASVGVALAARGPTTGW